MAEQRGMYPTLAKPWHHRKYKPMTAVLNQLKHQVRLVLHRAGFVISGFLSRNLLKNFNAVNVDGFSTALKYLQFVLWYHGI